MTVENQFPYQSFTANGSQTNFSLGFYVDDKDHFEVKKNGQVITKNDYIYNVSSNTIIFNSAPTQGDMIEIIRTTTADRATTYSTYNNTFRPEVLNKDIDRVWLKIQELGVAKELLKIYTDRLHTEQKNYIDNEDQAIKQIIADLRNYVNQQDNNQKTYLENLINVQGVSLKQLNDYYNHLLQGMADISAEKGWLASLVIDSSGKNQQAVNDKLQAGRVYFSDFGAKTLEQQPGFDCTSIFQLAMYACAQSKKQLCINVSGTYKINAVGVKSALIGAVQLDNTYNGLNVVGEGDVVIKAIGTNDDFFSMFKLTNTKNIQFQNLTFDGNGTKYFGSTNVNQFENGYSVFNTHSTSDNAVDNILFYNCTFRNTGESAITSYGSGRNSFTSLLFK